MSRSHRRRWIAFVVMVGLTGCQRDAVRIAPSTVAAAAAQNQTFARRTNSIDGAEMVYIPPGEFIMGSDVAELDRIWKRFNWLEEWKQFTKSEQPAHRVRVDGFRMYSYDVTVAKYRKFGDTTGRSMPAAPSWGWIDTHPIVNVSWEDARAYCSRARARLPYEAEWEYAARGGHTGLGGRSRTVFVWGDEYPNNKVANLADLSFKKSAYYNPNFYLFGDYDDGYTHTSPVGVFPANGFGLYDMAGNVWQWCEDWPMLATITILHQRIRTVRAMDNRVCCGAARSTRLPPLRESRDASATLRPSGTTKRASVAFNEAALSTGIRT